MATSILVPVEEYLRTSYDPDREYVNGQLVERHVGEYRHSLLQGLLVGLLLSRARERRFRVFPEQRVQVSAVPRYRIPDICVKALPHAITPVLAKPDLVIEILSSDDQPSEMLVKVGDYLQAGVPHVWIVDPYKQTLVVAGPAGIRDVPEGLAETDLVGRVDFRELLAQLDEPAE
ncbi:MAG TPA: Uma2 family endonuclease [Bryobacteraceae bacterium]|nr:Uma2 family endonuclease [Bryobacteraceae bacterium]